MGIPGGCLRLVVVLCLQVPAGDLPCEQLQVQSELFKLSLTYNCSRRCTVVHGVLCTLQQAYAYKVVR
eukprot:2632389-Amphidinium_carterae.3